MFSSRSWRDRQIHGFNLQQIPTILAQEKIMLDFMDSCGPITWQWHGDNNNLKNICSKHYTIACDGCQGIVIFGSILYGKSTADFCSYIQDLICDFDCVYLGVNRYTFSCHDLPFELPDLIEHSLDKIVNHCDPKFQRLYTFPEVDGNHMVAAHPLDCYGLCK